MAIGLRLQSGRQGNRPSIAAMLGHRNGGTAEDIFAERIEHARIGREADVVRHRAGAHARHHRNGRAAGTAVPQQQNLAAQRQPLHGGDRAVRRRLVVGLDQLQLVAVDAAMRVDLLEREPRAVVEALAEFAGGAGERDMRADGDRLLRRRAMARGRAASRRQSQAHDAGQIASESRESTSAHLFSSPSGLLLRSAAGRGRGLLTSRGAG